MKTNALIAAVVGAATVATYSGEAAASVTLEFEALAPLGGVLFGSPGQSYEEGGFSFSGAGEDGSSFFDAAWIGLDPTGSDYAYIGSNFPTPGDYALAVTAVDGSAFDLISFVVAGYFDADIRLRVDYELPDGTTASTAPFAFASAGGNVPTQTVLVGLSGIVRAVFVAMSDSGGGASDIALDDIVVSPSAVPLPSAALLFPVAAAGLAACRRRARSR